MYEYRCPRCGPFDLQRSMQDERHAASCPTCAEAAPRSYAVGGGVALTGSLRGAGQADRDRLDRARSGEPRVTGVRTERRHLRSGGHGH